MFRTLGPSLPCKPPPCHPPVTTQRQREHCFMNYLTRFLFNFIFSRAPLRRRSHCLVLFSDEQQPFLSELYKCQTRKWATFVVDDINSLLRIQKGNFIAAFILFLVRENIIIICNQKTVFGPFDVRCVRRPTSPTPPPSRILIKCHTPPNSKLVSTTEFCPFLQYCTGIISTADTAAAIVSPRKLNYVLCPLVRHTEV